MALALVLGVAGALYLFFKYMSIDRIGDVEIDAAEKGEPRNYLVVGSDVRAEGDVSGRRSDTVMVVRIDPDSKQAAVLSIPRDLVVPIAGTDETARINSAYPRGRATLMATIRENFGIELHHYVEVDFESFEGLVDSAGGVPLWIDRAIKDEASGLFVPDLGCTVLDGQQALAFVRSRELQYMTPDGRWSVPDPTADLGRIDRQQVFIRRALAKALGQVTSNPARIPGLIDLGIDAVAVDDKMSIRDLIDLAKQFRDFDPNSLRSYPLPTVEQGDGATLAVDPEAAEPVLDYFRGADLEEVTPGLVNVRVLNGTQVQGQAADVSGAFRMLGFQVDEPATSVEPYESTVLYHRPGDEAFARRALRHIPGGAQLVPREDLHLVPGHVMVVTGDDFTTVHAGPTPLDVMPVSRSSMGAGTSTTEPPEGHPVPPELQSSSDTGSSQFVLGDPPPGETC